MVEDIYNKIVKDLEALNIGLSESILKIISTYVISIGLRAAEVTAEEFSTILKQTARDISGDLDSYSTYCITDKELNQIVSKFKA